MPRAKFKIGMRGREEDVAGFREGLDSESGFWSGDKREPTDTEYVQHIWDKDADLVRCRHYARYWSNRFPKSEVYFSYQTQQRGALVNHELDTEISVGIYRAGELLDPKTIKTHAEFKKYFSGEDCDCDQHHIKNTYPMGAPFSDCPPRANPPTEWAVVNLMEAMEMLPRRR